jgi:predicted regulator of Ras-like GTPase activity (Roadblock/LC7/MglB family)
VRDVLQAILSELRTQAQQEKGDTVVTLDGREIARAVYRDVREQRVRQYES